MTIFLILNTLHLQNEVTLRFEVSDTALSLLNSISPRLKKTGESMLLQEADNFPVYQTAQATQLNECMCY